MRLCALALCVVAASSFGAADADAYNRQPASEELCRTRVSPAKALVDQNRAACERLPAGPREKCLTALEARSGGTCSQLVVQRALMFPGDLRSLEDWPAVDAAFESVHPSRFVFLSADVDAPGRKVKRGEVALVFKHAENGSSATLVTPDRQFLEVAANLVSGTAVPGAALNTAKAESLSVLQTDTNGKPFVVCSAVDEQTEDVPLSSNEVLFQLLQPTDPLGAKLTKLGKTFDDCYDKQLAKLDPDGRAGSYDLVTYDRRNGTVSKVEAFAEVIHRKACTACKCRAAQTQRRAIAREVCKAPRQEELERVHARVEAIKTALGVAP